MTERAEPSFEALLEGRVPAAAIGRLAQYGRLLERWSEHHSLVRAADREALVTRHLVESVAGADGLPSGGTLVDVGSGAGLPGVPLLCALPGWRGVLLEPRLKRATFLALVIRELDLDAEVVRDRFEALTSGTFDLVTARALGRHEALLAWAAERLAPGGEVRLWATGDEAARLDGLVGWTVLSSPLPGLDRGRLIVLKVCFT